MNECDTFLGTMAEVMSASRMLVTTSITHAKLEMGHGLANLERYAGSPGIGELYQCAMGRPAILAAAGPSLARNMRLLTRPSARERFIIIAVQTVLKTLLRIGVKPHFVTALDYSDLSARFYEGLTAEAVDGVTLVCEPRAHPCIPKAWPGLIRFPADPLLDAFMGEELVRESFGREPVEINQRNAHTLPASPTVALMSYQLARHMGCDPAILIGQDLAFTDLQYYGAGAAIHQVWSGELNHFNSIEKMEHERVMRTYSHVQRPVAARPKITEDDLLGVYLANIERDNQAGLTTIDATEGEGHLLGAKPMALADVLDVGKPE